MNTFYIKDEFIKLGQVLKACNMVENGAEAKYEINEGHVAVNGETDMRRGRKVYPGDTVTFGSESVRIEKQ